MKQKLLTLFTLLLTVCSGAWGQDLKILDTNFTQWKEGAAAPVNSGLSESNTYTLSDGVNDVATLVGKGCKLNDAKYAPTATGIDGYDTNKFRFGSSGNYMIITPTANFNKGGKICILVSSEKTSEDATLGTVKIGETSLGSLHGWTATATCDWQEFNIPSSIDGETAGITITRTDNTMFIWGIKIYTNNPDTRDAIPLTFSANVPTLVAGQKTTTTLEKTLGDGDTDSKYSVGYSSSDESVASVDANGIITAVAAGTATITATVTADADAYYKGNTASVEIAVTAGAGYVENMAMINYPSSESGITSGSGCSFTTVKINTNTNSVSAMKMENSYSEADNKRFTLSLSGGFKTGDVIKYAGVYYNDNTKNAAIDIYGQNEGEEAVKLTTSDNFINGKKDAADPADQTYTLLADYDNLYIGRNGNTNTYLTKLQITRSGYNVPVTSAGFATLYASDKSLDFSAATSVEAYIVTDATAEGAQTQKVTKVPAGTPLLIKSVSGDAVNEMVKVSPAETDDVDDNILKADGVTGDESTVYVLGAKDGKAVWGLLKNGSVLPAGKVYFKTNATLAKEFLNIIINDTEETSSETDGINKVSTNLENGVRYNLAGQKVSKDYKGIVIVNGRKMLNK